MEDSKISVLIADDNKEFCSILNDYLLNQKDIVVTGIAKDGRAKYYGFGKDTKNNYLIGCWAR